MSTALFIAMCVLAIINIILYTFVASAIHKRDLCQKSPYYHCDNDWICCMANQTNCDTAGVKIGTNAYYITDQIYGSGKTNGTDVRGLQTLTCTNSVGTSQGTYYELCVLPVQTVYKGYTGTTAPNLCCLYSANATDAKVTPQEFDDCVNHMSSYSNIFTFKAGQCCYQKIDPDTDSIPKNVYTQQNLYPNGVNNLWNSNGLYANNYTNSSDYTFPQGSNTDTKNNSCNNSFFSHNNPYNNCPPLPS